MMQWLDIEAFRGLTGLRLDGLGRINLLMGPNNSGKTSVLEALSLLRDPHHRLAWERAACFRTDWPFLGPNSGRRRVQEVDWLFPRQGGQAAPIRVASDTGALVAHLTRLTGTGGAGDASAWRDLLPKVGLGAMAGAAVGALLAGLLAERSESQASEQKGARISFGEQTPAEAEAPKDVEVWEQGVFENEPALDPSLVMLNGFSHRHEGMLQQQVSALIKAGQKPSVIDVLRRIQPAVRDLQILVDDSRGHGVFVEHAGQGFVPLSIFGDGMRRTLHFASGLVQARGGVLLIDEIEIAIHTSVIGAVFDWLVDACAEHDVQLFATTHSLEAVDAILAGRRDALEDIVSYRLEGGALKKRLTGERLHRLRYKMGSEVRG